MKIDQAVIDDIKTSRATHTWLSRKYDLTVHYIRAIKLGKDRFFDRLQYEAALFDKPYEFGKYPKTKYECYNGEALIYSFVTTIHPEEYCIDVLLDRLLLSSHDGKMRMFKTVNGIKNLIGNDSGK
jgi:hypothetical protein